MKVDIAGEDDVTRAVLLRLLKDLRPDIEVDKILPARGSQLKVLAPKYNLLNYPIILLTDLDQYDCPPSLLSDWLPKVALNRNFLFRIAYGETESWLMADRIGFSGWMETEPDLIPVSQTIDKFKNIREIVFPYKPSLYMMREIASKSKSKNIREGMIPKEGAKKGPLYNSTLIPFIQNIWGFHSASDHSTSLQRTIQKIINFNQTQLITNSL